MTTITMVGIAAGTLCTISFIPQVLKIWKTKSAKDVSLAMFAVFSGGITLWLAYGVMLKDAPIVIANSVTLMLALAIVVMKLKYK